ncbi:MAG TPA: hypothetical protein VI796_02535 [Candidatus Thermoplasmatota archaeon]|nr:hypothetical protein [Candidatus Thermoplasmatota archaeon]
MFSIGDGNATASLKSSEPTEILVEADEGVGRIGFKTTQGGVYTLLDAYEVPEELAFDLTRGDCDASAPFMGALTTNEGEATGEVLLLVGDAGIIPNLWGDAWTLEARCENGAAEVAVQVPHAKDTHWEGATLKDSATAAACEADYRFDFEDRLHYRVLSNRGVLEGNVTQGGVLGGYVGLILNATGKVDLQGEGRFDALELTADRIPTCLNYRGGEAKSLLVTGTGVAADLDLFVDESTGSSVASQFRLGSPSLTPTMRLVVEVPLERVYEPLSAHRATVELYSPFDYVDFYAGTGGAQVRPTGEARPGGQADGVSLVDASDVSFMVHFEGLQSFFGDLARTCSSTYDSSYQYSAQSGSPERAFADWWDITGCGRQALYASVMPLQANLQVSQDGFHAGEFTVQGSNDPIENLTFVSEVQCASCNQTWESMMLASMLGVPEGSTGMGYKTSNPGHVRVYSPQYRIERAALVFVDSSKPDSHIAFDVSGGDVTLEWNWAGLAEDPMASHYFEYDEDILDTDPWPRDPHQPRRSQTQRRPLGGTRRRPPRRPVRAMDPR